MPIPQLNPQYPNYGNVLAQGAAIKGSESRNALTQMQLKDYPEERNWLKKQREHTEAQWTQQDKDSFLRLSDEQRDRAIKVVDTAASWLNGTKTVAEYAEMRPVAIQKLGIDEKLYPDPSNFIKADGTPDNESYTRWKDMKVRQASNWKDEAYTLSETQARYVGGKKVAEGPLYGKEKAEFKVGATRTYQKGKETITEEYKGPDKGWVKKAVGPKWDDKDANKPEVKESVAIDRIGNIKNAIAKFDETGIISAWIMKNEPELAKTLNKATSPEDKKIAIDAMQKQATYYMGFLSDANKKIFGNDNDPLGIR